MGVLKFTCPKVKLNEDQELFAMTKDLNFKIARGQSVELTRKCKILDEQNVAEIQMVAFLFHF